MWQLFFSNVFLQGTYFGGYDLGFYNFNALNNTGTTRTDSSSLSSSLSRLGVIFKIIVVIIDGIVVGSSVFHQQLQIKVIVHNLPLLWLWLRFVYFCNCWLSRFLKEFLILQEIWSASSVLAWQSRATLSMISLNLLNARICPTAFSPLQPFSIQWSRSFWRQCCLFRRSPKFVGVFVSPHTSVQFKTDKEEHQHTHQPQKTLFVAPKSNFSNGRFEKRMAFISLLNRMHSTPYDARRRNNGACPPPSSLSITEPLRRRIPL